MRALDDRLPAGLRIPMPARETIPEPPPAPPRPTLQDRARRLYERRHHIGPPLLKVMAVLLFLSGVYGLQLIGTGASDAPGLVPVLGVMGGSIALARISMRER